MGTVCVLLLAAAALRVPLLDRRPMHADEAILADKFGTLLATGAYPYNPREYHGPVLAYLAWITAHLAGRTTYAALTETTLRIAPAIAGILVAISPLVLAPEIGATAALAAAALLAVSPVMVYYSRDFIPEMPLALWTALLLAALMRRSAGSWLMAGAAAALMCATKETAVLALGSAGIAYAAAFRPRRLNYRAAAVFCAALVTGISVLVLPPWKWGILPEALRAYLGRGLSGGLHAHPWYSYFRWLLGWHYSISEAPVLLLAAAGLLAARRNQEPAIRFLSFYAVLLFVFYSAIPYKTPWCAVSLLYALALLAGVAVAALARRWRAATRVVLGVVLGNPRIGRRGVGRQRAVRDRPAESVGVCANRPRRVHHSRPGGGVRAGKSGAAECGDRYLHARQSLAAALVFAPLSERSLVEAGGHRRSRRSHRAGLPGHGTGLSPQSVRGTSLRRARALHEPVSHLCRIAPPSRNPRLCGEVPLGPATA